MAKRLTISQRHSHGIYGGPRRYFQVFIHPDVDHFRGAATRYSGGDFTNAIACCHPAPVRERYDPDTDTWQQIDPAHWAGVLRFTAGRIDTEVVTHEVTHAALVVYRMDVRTDVRLGNGCRDREETLAYIVGDLAAAASNAMHDAGAWS